MRHTLTLSFDKLRSLGFSVDLQADHLKLEVETSTNTPPIAECEIELMEKAGVSIPDITAACEEVNVIISRKLILTAIR